ncbi:MAG: leucine-rich repeat protein [Bacteroidaceae bacterium]|nr:leucine-rich repeat protein [Bacteroidaceae bacterium]
MGTNIPMVYMVDDLTGMTMPAGYIFFRAGAAANQLELYVDPSYNGGYPSYNLEGQYKVIIPKKVVKFSDGVSGEIVLNYTVKGATTQVGDKFTVDSVHYIVTAETEVAVTYYGENKTNVPYEYKYTGAVVIPPNVIYEGITYKVTSIGDYTFYRNPELKEVTIPEGVTSIGDEAFRACSGLTKIIIPEGVTSINKYAFANCTGLKEVTIPEGVTSIGDEAFRACSGLTKVIIPEGVTSINKYAFANCTGLREITIPNSVTSIGESAFWVCEGLKEVVIPSSVTSMGVAAFSSCSGLTSITILDGVTSIGENAFISCTGLTEVIIPGSVISIGAGAFSGCSGLTSVSIGNGVTSLGKSAFSSCTGLTEVSIGNSVTSIGNNAFGSCTGLTEITIPNSVISIGEDAFISCTGLTEISIGNGIASIGRSAFWGCTNLKNIVIPKSVTSIGEYPFCDCTSLAEIVVEVGNTIYDSRKNCNAIIETATNTIIVGCQNTVIPEGVVSIGVAAFRGSTGLREITIPSSVASICDYAFQNCTNLAEICVEATTPPAIGSYAFYGVDKSIPVYIPVGCAEAYSSANGWSEFELTEIELEDVTPQVGDKFTVDGVYYQITAENEVAVTFYGSLPIATPEEYKYTGAVVIPESVSYQGVTCRVASIGQSAFYSCSGLTSIALPEGLTSIGMGAFENCAGLTSVTIPASVTSIGFNAFGNCAGLTSVSIGNDVKEIGGWAFSGCNGLTSVTIPSSVTSIGDYAFSWCNGLTEIRVEATTPPTIELAFDGLDKSIPVYVPAGCGEAYRSANGWSEFTNIIESESVVDVNLTDVVGIYNAYAYSAFQGYPNEAWQVTVTADNTTPGKVWIQPICLFGGLEAQEINPVYAMYNETDNTLTMPLGQVLYETSEQKFVTGTSPDGQSIDTTGEVVMSISITDNVIAFAYGYIFGIGDILTDAWWYQALYGFEFHKVLDKLEINGIFYNITSEKNKTVEVTFKGDSYDEYVDEYAGVVVIPETISYNDNTYSVTTIGDYAFYCCTGLTSVTIPNNVTLICSDAFYYCTRLTELFVEATVPPTVENNAFPYVDKSIPVYVPAGCGEAYRSATGWSEFTNIIEGKQGDFTHQIGDKFTVDGVHYQITTKTEVAVTFYGDGGIYEPLKYEYTGAVVIPESVTYQGVTYSVTSIGESAFSNSANLTSVTIPSSVTSIGDYAFSWCTNLTSVTIPSSVTSIGRGIFGGCSGLTSIRVEDGNTVYDSRDNCNAIIETATNNLIAGCKNTVISGSVTSIGKSAFHSIGLISITIPEGVTLIDEFAFTGCNNLTEIRIKAVNPPTVEIAAFERVDKSIPVYVPVGCGEAYRSATGWSEFTNIIEDVIPENYLVANDVEVVILDGIIKQSEISFSVSLNNSVEIAGLQCDVYLPDGLTPKMQGEKYDIVLSSRAQGFDVVAKLRNDGALRLVIFSTSLDAISSNKGELFTIMLQANEQYSTDDKIVIRNIVMTASDFAEYECPELEVACVLKESCSGDVNRDGNTNISDVVITVAKILGMYDGNFDAEAADANQDGVLDIADVAELINLILDHDNAPQRACAQGEYEKGNLAMNDTEIVQGTSKQIAVDLLNTAPYTAFQMDVRLPEGLVLEDVVAGDCTNSHSLQWREQADGRVRILGYSLSNELIDNDGETLLNLVLRADGEPGEGEVVIDGIIFVTNDIVTHQLDRVSARVNAVSGVANVKDTTRIYAIGDRIVVDSHVAQEAHISSVDGIVKSVALQPGRNEIPMNQQGVYVVAVESVVKKVVIK